MMALASQVDPLLACPVCNAGLTLSEGQAVCTRCSRVYPRDSKGTTYDFRCQDLLGSDGDHWNELQERGEASYLTNPKWNCSRWLKGGSYAEEFGRFCGLAGLVLDVGCGPYGPYPLAGSAPGTTFVGVEPLPTVDPDPSIVRALGERLPFRTATFDRVLMLSSLDHMLDPLMALREARRVLRSDGIVHVWTHGHPPNTLSFQHILGSIATKLAHPKRWGSLIARAVGILRRSARPHTNAGSDDYHVQLLDREHTAQLLIRAGFEVQQSAVCDGYVYFFNARRDPAA